MLELKIYEQYKYGSYMNMSDTIFELWKFYFQN